MFITRVRASAGDDRSPWGNFWFQPLGNRSSAGARVSAGTALQLSAVYSCVRVLSESFAILPFKLYRPRKNGKGRELVTDHWAVRLMKRPNPQQTGFAWREMMQGHLALRGNAYNEIVDGPDGSIRALLPLHPDRVSIEATAGGIYRYACTSADGSTRYLRPDQVWHVAALSDDGISGLSPIGLQREVIGGGLAAQEYGNRFWLNDAKPTGGWVEYPGKIADKATRQTLKESISEAISGANRHKMMVLDQGMKYHEVGLTNKDSQFLESRQFSRTEIAAMFRVPPHMIGDLSRATFSNIEQQSIDFWMGTMLPWTERWEAAIEALLVDTPDEDLCVEFDFRNLLRGDAVSRAAYSHSGVLDGWLTRNEARELEGYDPIDGLDEPLVPINEQTLKESNEPDEPVSPPGVDQPAKQQPAEESASARLVSMLNGNASRMGRRIAAGNVPSPDILAVALAIREDRAAEWLAKARSEDEEQITASLVALGSTT